MCNHPIKLPDLFWDCNGEEFYLLSLHCEDACSVALYFLHKEMSQSSANADQWWSVWRWLLLLRALLCWATQLSWAWNCHALSCACCCWQSSADFEGKRWLLSSLNIPWEISQRGESTSQTGVLRNIWLPVNSVQDFLICKLFLTSLFAYSQQFSCGGVNPQWVYVRNGLFS